MSEDKHRSLRTSFRDYLALFQSPNSLGPFTDLILWQMMDWSPNRRPSAILLKTKLSAVVKEANSFDVVPFEDTENINYPDMSPESVAARRRIMGFNIEQNEGPIVIDQIERDLVEGGEELDFDLGNFDNLRKTECLGRCIFGESDKEFDGKV